jgi:hypothetical protein
MAAEIIREAGEWAEPFDLASSVDELRDVMAWIIDDRIFHIWEPKLDALKAARGRPEFIAAE